MEPPYLVIIYVWGGMVLRPSFYIEKLSLSEKSAILGDVEFSPNVESLLFEISPLDQYYPKTMVRWRFEAKTTF